ncbi:tRNA uridine-5-carboxymethylaminomethyl(34) synthesis GTPase MnmE [Acidobacteria bacterium AH-259-O06]|nr:tRNA uridine-5-carboxymethylaminomethyl(34) synthesis GTPase MnmE [Acidobacteria bacterium AH-259-O06]
MKGLAYTAALLSFPTNNLPAVVNYNQGETIVATSTPPGRGAIALIRVSGPEAKNLVAKQFRSGGRCDWAVRRPLLGHFLDTDGNPLDQVLTTFFLAPASYTGEDLVEISCHGSPVVARRIVETILKSGARLAEPGEFTLRAFLNAKMDLAQAEAVRDLIESQTGFQAKVAAEQLEGKLSRTLEPLKKEIVRILCHMETAVEFVEDDVKPEAREQLMGSLEKVDQQLEKLEESFRLGRIVQEGIKAAIAGKPNAGKSSLFNGLLRDDRAIVTDVPGTTRDALTETIDLEGIPTRLADTAGIREVKDRVEHLGVQKSLQYLRESDAVLFVVDRTRPFDEEDYCVWRLVQEYPCVLVLNKEDLPSQVKIPQEVEQTCAASVSVSALKGTHLDDVKKALLKVVTPDRELEKEDALITSIRHKRCIEVARNHLQAGIASYHSGMSEEFPLYDFRKALDAIAEITGETTVEDILQQIFSTFCIGK